MYTYINKFETQVTTMFQVATSPTSLHTSLEEIQCSHEQRIEVWSAAAHEGHCAGAEQVPQGLCRKDRGGERGSKHPSPGKPDAARAEEGDGTCPG